MTGGKAEGLRALQQIGRVPPFVVFDANWIAEHLSDLQAVVSRHVESKGLREPFAVRSSANVEDSVSASFAGLFKTRLGVSLKDLGSAASEVAASGDAHRVMEYGQALGLEGETTVAVIVQELVVARSAGVALSRHPTKRGHLLIEAVRGLGDELVSGRAEPDVLAVDRSSLKVTVERRGRQLVETTPDGGRRLLPRSEVTRPKLSETEARTVAAITLAAEDKLFPTAGVDIEWAFDTEGLALLQCRPLTVSYPE